MDRNGRDNPMSNPLDLSAGVFRETEVAAIFRATLVSSIGIAIAGAALAALVGEPLAAVGVVVGLVAGATSNRVFQTSTTKVVAAPGRVRRQVGTRALARLGVVTVVVLGLLVLVPPVGAGALIGLALFQVALLYHVTRLLLRQRKGP
jgi:hypothetical protein